MTFPRSLVAVLTAVWAYWVGWSYILYDINWLLGHR